MARMKWAYSFPSGTATVGYDAAAETGTVKIPPEAGNITVAFGESGTVTTGYIFTVAASHDGTNFGALDLTPAATADASTGEALSFRGGWEYIRVTCTTWVGGTGDVIATVGWMVD